MTRWPVCAPTRTPPVRSSRGPSASSAGSRCSPTVPGPPGVPANSLSEEKRMAHVLGYMGMMGARHAYSMNPLLQWQLAFYSKEEIVARWINRVDRYPAYVIEVDRALQSGETVALVGYQGFTGGLEKFVPDPKAIVPIYDRYFVYLGPDKPLLKKLGFRFSD